MAEQTKIEWADHTFNPWIGCTKVGPGCDHCYAEADFDKRRKVVMWGAGQERKRTAASTWSMPLRWNAQAEAFQAQHGRRQRVFCASLGDWADNAVPVQWRIDLMRLILSTPNLDWLLLTKRIGNAADMLETAFRACHGQREGWADNVPPNVWIGATICNQEEADRDIPKLLRVPAAMRFLSIEPLLGPVDLAKAGAFWSDMNGDIRPEYQQTRPHVDWVIVGGESGTHARPMHPDWARSLRDQCEAAGMPFLFKQWGEWAEVDTGLPQPLVAHFGDPEFYDAAIEHDAFLSIDGHFVTNPDSMNEDVPYRGLVRVGKKAAGRLLDGRTWDGVPS